MPAGSFDLDDADTDADVLSWVYTVGDGRLDHAVGNPRENYFSRPNSVTVCNIARQTKQSQLRRFTLSRARESQEKKIILPREINYTIIPYV